MNLLLIVVVSLLTCCGQLCQKQAAHQSRHKMLCWLAASLLLLGAAMLLWLWVLQRVPVGVAYPMLSLNFILVVLAARWIWHEAVTARHWLGIVLIVSGVALMGVWA